MNDTTKIVFFALLGAGLGALMGVGGLMAGMLDPVVAAAGSGGALALGTGGGLLVGVLLAGLRIGGRDKALEVDSGPEQAATAQRVTHEENSSPQPEVVEASVEEDPAPMPTPTPEDHGSLFDDMDAAEDSGTPGYQPSFQSMVFAMGGDDEEEVIVDMKAVEATKKAAQEAREEQPEGMDTVSGGFGDLMASLGGRDERAKRVASEDRVIASGASTNPMASAMSGEVEPSEPGQFEVVGHQEVASADVDALRDALNQPTEPDPLRSEPAGLEEDTSPNELRNNLLAARMRRREKADRPQRQMRRLGAAEAGPRGATPTPEELAKRVEEEQQLTRNLKPAMHILRKPSSQEAGIDSRDGDLRVPEPERSGPVMTVRIDDDSQQTLLSEAGE